MILKANKIDKYKFAKKDMCTDGLKFLKHSEAPEPGGEWMVLQTLKKLKSD
jgi:hypothetical protein